MLKIALCDDSALELETVKNNIEEYMNSLDSYIAFNITAYPGSMELLYDLEEGRTHDIYILDVEMPEMNGIELAQKVNETIPSALIIFLTSHHELWREGYKIRALSFVVKVEIDEKLGEALSAAIKELNPEKEHTISLTRYREITRVPYCEIIYVLKNQRQLEIATVNYGFINDNRGLKEFFALLDDSRFVMIDKGCFINVGFAIKIAGDEVILTNGTRLRYSRRTYADIKAALTKGLNK